MAKIKNWMKNTFYYICFLFRPILTIGVSFVFMLISLCILIIVIKSFSKDTKTYEILLAMLTGITASFFVSIIIESCNNYRFNYRRYRELRKYFRFVSGYKLRQRAYMKSRKDNDIISELGNGYAYDVFTRLNEVIPNLRESLVHSDYFYHKEIQGIDDVIYNYDNLVRIIESALYQIYLILIMPKNEDLEDKDAEDKKKDKFIENYPELYKYIKKEIKDFIDNLDNESADFHKNSSKYLKSIIEKAIFHNPEIFSGYFEVTDKRYIEDKEEKLEDVKVDETIDCEQRHFNFLSNKISYKCGVINKSMTRLQRRAGKEPYFRLEE